MWILIFIVPVQSVLFSLRKAQGPSHFHRVAEGAATRTQGLAPTSPLGLQWANSPHLRTAPGTDAVIAALRGKAHGGQTWRFRWNASRADAAMELRTGEHASAHRELRRHHHSHADDDVVVDLADKAGPVHDANGGQNQVMAWAPPGGRHAEFTPSPSSAAKVSHAPEWQDHHPARPERPPWSTGEARA